MTEQAEKKRFFEVKQIGGTHKWLVVEFWEGGQTRGPFFSKEEALNTELERGKRHGWTNLQKA